MMVRQLLAVLCILPIGGCATEMRDIGREPHMTPVGAGLLVYTPPTTSGVFPAAIPSGNRSFRQIRQNSSEILCFRRKAHGATTPSGKAPMLFSMRR